MAEITSASAQAEAVRTSLAKLGEMQKQMIAQQLDLDSKLMKFAVYTSVGAPGTGETIDTSV